MGESFMGFPNRQRGVNNLMESTYNPNHFLSAHMGYILHQKFSEYIPFTGGTLIGTLMTCDMFPNEMHKSNIGDSTRAYNSVHAKSFHGSLIGNASSASKFKDGKTISISGAVTGAVVFDGTRNVDIVTERTHDHDDRYLRLDGGALTGNVILGEGSSILASDNTPILSLTSNHVLSINYGGYLTKLGKTTIYSTGDFDVQTHSAGMMITSSLYKKTVNIGTSRNTVYLENTVGHDYLRITDDGELLFNDKKIHYEGNFLQKDIVMHDTHDKQIESIKNVVKVLTILLDQLEVTTKAKPRRDYPGETITDELEYYKIHAIEVLNEL